VASEESDETGKPEPEPEPEPEAAPRPKRRKKKRRAEAAEPSAVRRAPAGWPAFARNFPEDPELERLVEAFERGNFAAVRAGAPRLAREAGREEVRRAAAELLKRTQPDPLAAMLLLAAVGLLVFLSIWYWSHQHGP